MLSFGTKSRILTLGLGISSGALMAADSSDSSSWLNPRAWYRWSMGYGVVETHVTPAKRTLELPLNYQTLSADEKLPLLWANINTPYAKLPEIQSAQLGWFGSNLCPAHLNTTFDCNADVMPAGRKKMIHASGAVATFEYISLEGHALTGIFKTGAKGVIRFSLGTGVDPSFTPGAGLKFLIDGEPSVNLQVMYQLDGQGQDHNFFAHALSNDIPQPTSSVLKVLGYFFGRIQNPPTHLPLRPLAAITRDGTMIANHNVPMGDIIRFQPTDEAARLILGSSRNDFRYDLATKVPTGTHLYNVMAFDADGQERVVGEIHTTSSIVASLYGDRLFFQHHRG